MYKAGTTVVVDVYSVSGMDHAVALGTDTLGTCPGVSGAQYFENKNVCSTLRAAQFFGLLGSTTTGTGTDTTPPQLAFETPSDGATVTGAVTIVIAASDNVGVTDVDLAVDGVAIGSVTMAPFQIVWDASTVVDGMHTLTAVGRDAAGNTATATASITVADNVGGTGSGSGSGSGSDGDGAGPNNDLPACTVGAAASPRALWPIAAAFATPVSGFAADLRRSSSIERASAAFRGYRLLGRAYTSHVVRTDNRRRSRGRAAELQRYGAC